MRTFLLSSVAALALTVATGALAASPDNTAVPNADGTAATSGTGVTEGTGTLVNRDQIEARTLVGKAVYDVNGDKIGSIDDVILAPSGQGAQQAVIKSGGFLGIGEKLIAVSIADLKPGRDKDTLVVNGLTRQQVRDMRTFAYDQSTRSWRNTQTAAGTNDMANGSMANGNAGTGLGGPAVAPAAGAVNSAQPRMLIGKEVVDAGGKRIGTVDNVLMDASGSKPEKVVIASGGFLGIGEKLIAVDFSQLTLPGAAAAVQGNDANGNAMNGNAVNGAAPQNGVTNGVANGTAVDQNGNPVPNAAPALARNNDVAVIAGLTQEQVKDLPDFRYDPSMRTANQVANGNLASAPASTATGSSGSSATDNGVAATTGNDNAGATASIDRNAVDLKQLIGKVVVDANGDRVGTVDNVLMDANGERPERAVIASGGFLGIGKKLIAVEFSQLKIGDDGRAHVTGLTREQVRDMKDFRYDPSMRTYHNSAS